MVLLGFDIGGTFTDIYAIDEDTDEIYREKTSTTPEDPSAGVMTGISDILQENDLDPTNVSHLAHGSTIATNAMLEHEGATTGVITTEGFRDIIAIGREKRQNLYNTSPEKTPTFTDRKNRLGVNERISADGTVSEPLNEDEVVHAVKQFESEGVESLAVSLLHSYRNSEHERRIKELAEEHSELPVSLSSEVMAEIKEYERTLSTVINAYVQPLVEDYIDRLQSGLEDLGIENQLHLMQASGGVMTPETIHGRSLQMINSGPAGGVIGAKESSQTAGIENIITLDMGGTSADTCVVKDREMETTTEGEIGGVPLYFPQVDVRTVGAGGGSIAWQDRADILKIGPKSAGAQPGPACYDRGGTDPTVTDAALHLGFLNPGYFLGGEMTLDVDAADAALQPLADSVGEDLTTLSDGILNIATTNMTQAIELVTVEKGYDPRNFTLVCYGGAGPLFATRLARKLDIDTAFVPNSPGVLSATGMLAADKRFSFSQSRKLLLEEENLEEIQAIYRGLENQAKDVLGREYHAVKTADMRYDGQTFEQAVDFTDDSLDQQTISDLRRDFEAQYETIYGYSAPEKDIEVVTWRLEAIQETKETQTARVAGRGRLEDAVKTTRNAYTPDDGWVEHTVYDRYSLPSDITFEGPAIIEEAESTAIAGVGSTVRVDDYGNLLIDV